ncbi:hypothetical protein NKG94_25855 [Micromonospora sp. M12]
MLLDATIIRGVVLPALMTLLGDANWWARASCAPARHRLPPTRPHQPHNWCPCPKPPARPTPRPSPRRSCTFCRDETGQPGQTDDRKCKIAGRAAGRGGRAGRAGGAGGAGRGRQGQGWAGQGSLDASRARSCASTRSRSRRW